MNGKKDITSKIERLELFEDHLRIRLSALSAYLSGRIDPYQSFLTINGEVTVDSGVRLEDQFAICAAVYDESGRVVSNQRTSGLRKDFPGFEILHMEIGLQVDTVSKIRIYPKLI